MHPDGCPAPRPQYRLNVPVLSTTTRWPPTEDGIFPDAPSVDTKTFKQGSPPESPMAVPETPGMSITLPVSFSRALFISSVNLGPHRPTR